LVRTDRIHRLHSLLKYAHLPFTVAGLPIFRRESSFSILEKRFDCKHPDVLIENVVNKEALLFIHVSDKNGKYEITEEYEI